MSHALAPENAGLYARLATSPVLYAFVDDGALAAGTADARPTTVQLLGELARKRPCALFTTRGATSSGVAAHIVDVPFVEILWQGAPRAAALDACVRRLVLGAVLYVAEDRADDDVLAQPPDHVVPVRIAPMAQQEPASAPQLYLEHRDELELLLARLLGST